MNQRSEAPPTETISSERLAEIIAAHGVYVLPDSKERRQHKDVELALRELQRLRSSTILAVEGATIENVRLSPGASAKSTDWEIVNDFLERIEFFEEKHSGATWEEARAALNRLSPEPEGKQPVPLWDFWNKHAMPPKVCPSCLVCGQSTPPDKAAITHMQLPGIVVCVTCRDNAKRAPEPVAKRPTVDDVIAELTRKAVALPMGAVVQSASLNNCSEYNAYKWAITQICDAYSALRDVMDPKPSPTKDEKHGS